MRFFVPQSKPSHYDRDYQAIAEAVKSQLGWKLADRQIYSLRHQSGKHEIQFEVGELAPPENYYQVIAILESNSYIVFTRARDGRAGTTILVDKAEVLAIEDFESKKATKS